MANIHKKSSLKKAISFVRLEGIPGPRGWDLVVKYRRLFNQDALKAFKQVYEDFGDISSYPWPMNSVFIYSPEYLRKVLLEEGRKFVKGEQTEELRAIIGKGLFTNNDIKSWQKSRSIIAKEFSPNAVVKLTPHVQRICDEHLELWSRDVFETDICEDMKFLTFKIACQLFLKANLGKESSLKVNEAIHYTSMVMHERIFSFFPIPYSWPTKKNRAFHKHYSHLDEIVSKLIEDEQKAGKKSDAISLLAKLVHAIDDETKSGLTPDEVKDEVLTLMLGGHESSAHSLTWTLGLLAKHQEVQNKLYALLKNNSHEADVYLRLILLESMRLYPPFPVVTRKATEEVKLGTYTIYKNTNVIIPIYVIQRSEKLWANPCQFIPERFKNEETERELAFLPFSKGTRRCVAELFAMAEMAIVIKSIISKYKLELIDSDLPQEVAFMTLRPVDGLRLKVSARSHA